MGSHECLYKMSLRSNNGVRWVICTQTVQWCFSLIHPDDLIHFFSNILIILIKFLSSVQAGLSLQEWPSSLSLVLVPWKVLVRKSRRQVCPLNIIVSWHFSPFEVTSALSARTWSFAYSWVSSPNRAGHRPGAAQDKFSTNGEISLCFCCLRIYLFIFACWDWTNQCFFPPPPTGSASSRVLSLAFFARPSLSLFSLSL